MESDPALQDDDGVAPEVLALARVVARLRAEVVELEGVTAMSAVVERAKGVVMAREGVPADEACELLRARAGQGRRSLLEECWITLGRTGSGPLHTPATATEPLGERPGVASTAFGSGPDPAGVAPTVFGSGPDPAGVPPTAFGSGPDPAAVPPTAFRSGPDPAGVAPTAFGSGPDPAGGTADSGRPALLAALAAALAGARTPDDVAEVLRATLAGTEDVDAVMIYAGAVDGHLELVGHAGTGDALAEQWSHIPPVSGVAPREAVTDGKALWLDDPERDASRHPLIGDGPERWPSSAWIPVPGKWPPVVVGLFRTRHAPFDAGTRLLLRRAVRLCGGPLDASAGRRPPRAGQADEAVVQRIFDALPGPAALLTPLRSPTGEVEDFRIDAAAPESVDVAGRRGKELVGRRLLETYPTMAGTPVWDGYLKTLATGTASESGPFTYEQVSAGAPRRSTYSVRASRLADRLVVSWICHDTAEREARRLADMQRLGNLGWVSWNLVTDRVTWSDQVYTILGRARAHGPMPLDELPGLVVPDDLPRLGTAVRRLLDDGASIDEPFRVTVGHGRGVVRHLRIVAEAQTDADGTPVEVHGFVQDLTAQRDAEIARRESERAVLVQRGMLQAERTLAARLQETLLPIPEQSLELAGVCVSVAYVAADSGLNVGGDWYSAIELPDGNALFVVGDVAGHSLAAVGTMAQLRFTTKGMTITGSALPDVLRRLNALLLHTPTGSRRSTATMVMGRYDPRDRRLTWVRAGHLPPLLVRHDEARFLPQPEGILLGAARDSFYEQAEIELLPDDHLLLYTDGLIEDPGEDIAEGLARLADTALRFARDGQGENLAPALAAWRPHNRDDICVLDVHVPDSAS
ncbi:SpoIIE family protein phosphatase [Streptomyces sp. V3I7]|uniref:SpoIIE family protein phosphatase n=1 Tax=Streptomyces sp. V3I7 TaxID=3042278 RepID=UPI002785820E|nr:SpoIIE family protein phosphatase [Streptomyces sp. V3I7]MDQ0994374.1 serine phosphatase RsbU (regulator of sigma subunit) [Streptomyces sp. V3I7]